MASVLRLRKLYYVNPVKNSSMGIRTIDDAHKSEDKPNVVVAYVKKMLQKKQDKDRKKKRSKNINKGQSREWKCLDNCCWIIGYMCTFWWLMFFVYHYLPLTLPGFPAIDSPGAVLKRDGVSGLHPVVLVPGIVTGGLELWDGKPCAKGLFRKRLWGGSFTETLKRPLCWLEHLSLDNETGLDPPGIRIRPVEGLVAADYFTQGYFVWAVLIENLAKIGYDGKNLHMAAYDWRIAFQNTEVRDRALSRLKSKIEVMYETNGGNKVVVVPHSMGVLYFLHFMKWVEAPPPMGGGGGLGWCAKYIKAIMNIGSTFLGTPKAVSKILSAEDRHIALLRAMTPGFLKSEILGFQTLEHMLRVSRTWDSTASLLPKGGETIWGDLDWSPEDVQNCDLEKADTHSFRNENDSNDSEIKKGFQEKEAVHYGRMISFGKEAATRPSSELSTLYSEELMDSGSSNDSSFSCSDGWTEYDEMSRESLRKVSENKAYTAKTVFDLLRVVAPKMMQRMDSHFSHGIAEDLDDPKYAHYKYWSNPLETKLPDAPDMEIYCLYGVGIPTERSYIYDSSYDKCKSIPFRIDLSIDGEGSGCLRSGMYFVDGDDSVPVVSSGFMCAKGWRNKTRFNPSGSPTYVREYRHKAPASLLEGRGIESSAHVDIMGNAKLIEDILRVAAGATGAEIGGDRIYSDILTLSERINLKL
ncbi:putative phospholipid:diacylglycerol acyltransferase 2, partial [Cucurbita argyrosperma subsp. sororia]